MEYETPLKLTRRSILGFSVSGIYFLLGYIFSRNPLYLVPTFLIILLILSYYVFKLIRYSHKRSLILSIPFIILQGLSLLYCCLLWPIYLTDISSIVLFCIFASVYVFIVVMLIHVFNKRHKYDHYY